MQERTVEAESYEAGFADALEEHRKMRAALADLLRMLRTYYFETDDPNLAAINRARRLLGWCQQNPKHYELLYGGSTYLIDAIDALPETPLDEVMLEVVTHQRCAEPREELREKIVKARKRQISAELRQSVYGVYEVRRASV